MKAVQWKNNKIFVPEGLTEQEEQTYVKSAISSLMRWKPITVRKKKGKPFYHGNSKVKRKKT
jgi:hypothetical protein